MLSIYCKRESNEQGRYSKAYGFILEASIEEGSIIVVFAATWPIGDILNPWVVGVISWVIGGQIREEDLLQHHQYNQNQHQQTVFLLTPTRKEVETKIEKTFLNVQIVWDQGECSNHKPKHHLIQ
jgi:hypothetical protein